MDFFERIIEEKLIVLIISLIINGLLLSCSGYLLYKVLSHECHECPEIVEDALAQKESETAIDEFYVELKGEVKKPGVYLVNSKNIINDVVTTSGGFTKNAYTKNINLSKKLKEEMVIYVYSKNEYKKLSEKDNEIIEISECVCPTLDISECISNGSSEIVSTDTELDDTKTNVQEDNDSNNNVSSDVIIVNINTASKEELMTLNGIGEAKAIAIIEYRTKNKFKSIEEIKNISGIGDSSFEKIKDNITV